MRATAVGLAAGSYSANVTITETSQRGKIRVTVLPVTLSITATTVPPAIQLSLSSLAFSSMADANSPTLETFNIANTGGGSFAWTANETAEWLTLSLVSGTNIGTVAANISTTGLTAGTYSTTVTVSAPGAMPKAVPVSLTVMPTTLTPAFGLSTTSLGFTGTVAGANPSAQTIGISNTGNGTLTWSACAGDSASWLTLNPLSGTNAGMVTATANLAGLSSGSYTATVTVAATGAIPKTVPVTLTVAASPGGGTISFSPASLAFAGTVGGTNPTAKTFSITNTSGSTLSWTVSDNTPWLQFDTASGTTTTETDTISTSVISNGLAAGTYNAIITITTSGSTNNPRQIPVSLTLSTSAPSTANLSWNASMEPDWTGYKVYRSTASGTYGTPLATLPKRTTRYATTGMRTGAKYYFVITAHDSSGNESTYSSEVSKSVFEKTPLRGQNHGKTFIFTRFKPSILSSTPCKNTPSHESTARTNSA